MSLRYEQYRALRRTKQLLHELLTVEGYPKTKKEMRSLLAAAIQYDSRYHACILLVLSHNYHAALHFNRVIHLFQIDQIANHELLLR